MPRPRPAIALLIFVLAAFAPHAPAGLPETVERLIREADLGPAVAAVSILETGRRSPLVEIRADEPMIPASNMKLLTAGAALDVLGPDFRFRTRLLRAGDRLIVAGDGDPAFGDPVLLADMTTERGTEMDVEMFLDLWVRPVVDLGLPAFGELIVDDRVFDREYVHPTWPRDQLNRRYSAQVSGLAFHLNILHFYPQPRPGQRPSLSIFEPKANWLDVKNRATSRTGPRDQNDVWAARVLGTNNITLYGNVKHAYTRANPAPVTVHDMPMFFARLLAGRLRAAGVEIETARTSRPDDAWEDAEPLGPVIYTPIDTILQRCNRDSQNLYAGCLLKRMGHAATGQPGTWVSGASIIRHVVFQRLSDASMTATLHIADGSGLSRDNRATTRLLAAWLDSFHRDPRRGPILLESLPLGGETGTLKRRSGLDAENLDGAVVRAKSGYISGVSCLSGYVTHPDGGCRCFSIMVNDIKGSVRSAKRMQEAIIAAIVEDMAAVPVQLTQEP